MLTDPILPHPPALLALLLGIVRPHVPMANAAILPFLRVKL